MTTVAPEGNDLTLINLASLIPLLLRATSLTDTHMNRSPDSAAHTSKEELIKI
jgi:hypothetical protein